MPGTADIPSKKNLPVIYCPLSSIGLTSSFSTVDDFARSEKHLNGFPEVLLHLVRATCEHVAKRSCIVISA